MIICKQYIAFHNWKRVCLSTSSSNAIYYCKAMAYTFKLVLVCMPMKFQVVHFTLKLHDLGICHTAIFERNARSFQEHAIVTIDISG